jgi:methoxymalonate biosynthesis acyl carrier protein
MSLESQAVRRRIREFLLPHFRGHELRDDDDIFGLGYVNSLFAMQLVLFVEREFRISVRSAGLEFEQIRSVDALVRLVAAKTVDTPVSAG